MAQGAGPAFRAADFRRREGSAADRARLLRTARGARALEPADLDGAAKGQVTDYGEKQVRFLDGSRGISVRVTIRPGDLHKYHAQAGNLASL